MLSKVVTTYVKSSDKLLAALREFKGPVGEQMAAWLAPVLEKGETAPDVAFLFELIARRVERAEEAMTEADIANSMELGDDHEPRQRRDQAVADVRAELLQIKQTLQALFGDREARAFGLQVEIEHDPLALEGRAGTVLRALKENELPKPKMAGVIEVNKAPWIAGLKRARARLSEALHDVGREQREVQLTQRAKREALTNFESVYKAGAALCWATLIATGHPDWADTIPLTPRRAPSGKRKKKSQDE